ncbi:MAG: aminoglycoside phosphotransferase family protein [Cyclobacteriaceae bacterium]
MVVDITSVLQAFGIANPVSIEGIVSGLINETYLVETDASRFILQRVNKEVFPDAAKVMENIEIVQDVLESIVGYQVPELIESLDGKLFQIDPEGYAWRLMRYIPNSITHDSTEDVSLAAEAGLLLGKFHRATSSLDPERLHVTLPNFHNLGFRVDLFLGSLQNASNEKLAKASESIAFVEETLPTFDKLQSMNLPLRVTHNDTKLNNLLFERTSSKGLCLIDLDTLMPGFLHHDFGDAIRTLCNSLTENDKNLDALYFNMPLFEHFTKGYLSKMDNMLTEEEWTSLPISIELMPFIMGLRFLTDYMYGNIYYKTDYQDQNLDRCRNQFTLVERIIERRAEIAATIESNRS